MAPTKPRDTTRFHTCEKDCYGACVYEATWDDINKQMLSTKPLSSHPFTQGFFCDKYSDKPKALYHPDRLKQPLVRQGPKGTNDLVQVDNDQAWRMLGTRTREIVEKHGPRAILGVSYSGNSGIVANNFPLRFFGAIGATVTGGGICNEGGIAGLRQLFGTYSTTNPFQLLSPEARLIVVWGSDMSSHNIHAHAMAMKAVKSGAKLVVIDTRKTAIAMKADLFIHATPGTEGLIALLVLKHLLAAGGADLAFLDGNVTGHDAVARFVAGLDEKQLLNAINIEARAVDDFTRMLLTHKDHTIFNVGFGLQKYVHGGENIKAIALLQVFLGNIGKPGCGIIYSQSSVRREVLNAVSNHVNATSVLGPVTEVPLIELARALESGKYKMIVVFDCNPASSLPDQERLRKQLARDDLFVVVHELHLNATTRFADMVFPAKYAAETCDLVWAYYVPCISITQAGPCPYPACTSNAAFFRRLVKESGVISNPRATLLDEPEDTVVVHCLDLAGEAVKRDLVQKGFHLLIDEHDVLFEDMRFPTADGRIHAAIPALPLVNKREPREFFLITPMHRRFIHSQLGELNEAVQHDFDLVYLHPADAPALSVHEGDAVWVSTGTTRRPYTLALDAGLAPGTALIYSGGPSVADGSRNANFFTPGIPESLGGSGSYNAGRVRITKVGK
ncbi:MAG: molybdopterin-dependent oxidoreductase [Candidatus Lokiarchaeota archaeon]|nr:molybdopterin-dependent oxidoreductase [Candidatus Lokiarchaeota archaeon]